ncbi:MAG: thioesterase family protein [Actinomycetota bacterium]|nr:thioesterase family protein [Actinomycetota bacterium]
MTVFARDTTLEALGDGRYRVEINRNWWVAVGPNGGLVAAILLRACETEIARPGRLARTLTVHYLSPPREGDAEVEVTVERDGRGVTFCTARLRQGDRLEALAVAAFSDERPAMVDFDHLRMPDVPPPDACGQLVSDEQGPAIRHRWDSRWVYGPTEATGTDEAVVGGWIRLSEPEQPDAAVMAAMADAWVPPIFCLPEPPPTTVPTLELTVHFRDHEKLAAMAPDEWCLTVFRSETAREGFIDESGAIWTADGHLLAQARQLAVLVPLPAEVGERPRIRFEQPS